MKRIIVLLVLFAFILSVFTGCPEAGVTQEEAEEAFEVAFMAFAYLIDIWLDEGTVEGAELSGDDVIFTNCDLTQAIWETVNVTFGDYTEISGTILKEASGEHYNEVFDVTLTGGAVSEIEFTIENFDLLYESESFSVSITADGTTFDITYTPEW